MLELNINGKPGIVSQDNGSDVILDNVIKIQLKDKTDENGNTLPVTNTED